MKTWLLLLLFFISHSGQCQEETVYYYVPNIMTPDCCSWPCGWRFYTIDGNPIDDFHVTVYNRWGEKVYESNDMEQMWEGKYMGEGELVEDGVYIWVLEGMMWKDYDMDGKEEYQSFEDRGHVTILK